MTDEALTAFVRKRRAVAVLRTLNDLLNSSEFLIKVEELEDAEQAEVGKLMFSAALAYQKPRTAALIDLRAELERNAAELDNATKTLADTLADFKKIKPILDGATAFLKVFARVVLLVR